MKQFEYKIVKGKDLLTVSKEEFIEHTKVCNDFMYSFKKIGDITYYFDRYNRIIAEREVINV